MSIISVVLVVLLAARQSSTKQQYVIPTSEVVRVATMAARDEGYDPNAPGMFLDELRLNGKEPVEGYTSIALYKNDHAVRSYSIRLATGDVVDATVCKVFRYPDLIGFKKKVLRDFGSREVSLDDIATEVGCAKLEVIPAKAAAKRRD
jgi:hypothetical protein